ncbi:phage major capsid protein [Mesobacillus subterraneus]|uniref:phage major capsid protein n=1 Tax=Mesobacillus subterraneus TaxID=285983 RepID=UPI001CFC92C1|nr:phage major capsid protein [Mesobacillus subterraneus]WLR53557.1 phage major capsid protein [Mesobacillus subterraneus]
MNRLQEILARKQEIRSLLEGDQEVDVKAIEEELRQLQEEESKIIEKRKLAEGIQMGQVETREIPKPTETRSDKVEIRSMKWQEAYETDEYRSAWVKTMMGATLSAEERDAMDHVNDEYRAFTHNTENTQILIPKTVAAGIWKRAEEEYPLWADVRKFNVKGNLSMIKSSTNSVNAQWYDEEDVVDTDQLGFGQLDLTGCELAKAVQVTWKLKKMALAEFEAYIIREIGDRMGISLSTAVYVGKGKPGGGDTFKPEPRGIKTVLKAEANTPQIKAYAEADGVAFNNLTGLMAALHSSYVNGATIYANNTTIWNTLANVVDGQGRPMFIADVQAGGVGRILGRSIKPDAAIPDGEILVGNVNAGYVANINEDITMYREDHVRERLTDYMGYAIVDGDVLDSKAFVILEMTPTV